MTLPERTRQRLDPIGTFGVSLTTMAFTVGAFAMGSGVVISRIDELRNAPLAVVALVFLGMGAVRLIVASNPIRAPFTSSSMAVVVTAGVVACALELGSVWDDPLLSANQWGPFSLGLLFLAMGPYRPAREIVVAGSIAAIFIGFFAVLRNDGIGLGLPPLAVVAVSVMPVLALAYASAAHAKSVVDALDRWQRKMQRPGRGVSNDDEDGIARSVQQDRVTVLNREVLPFFFEAIEARTVTDADRERARGIASAFRQVMVADVDRSWLEQVAVQISGKTRNVKQLTVRDDDHLASYMSYDQRTALRAFLLALSRAEHQNVDFVDIELFRENEVFCLVMTAQLEITDFTLKSHFSPYFAVLRVMFPDLRVEYHSGTFTLSFSYDQR